MEFPNASKAFRRLNPWLFSQPLRLTNDEPTWTNPGPAKHTRKPADLDSAPAPKSQPASRHAPHVTPQPEAAYPGRVRIRVTSYRCGTQCDPDNLAAKYFIDCCRYARLIRDDTKGCIELEVTETRVPTKKEEGTLIEIFPL